MQRLCIVHRWCPSTERKAPGLSWPHWRRHRHPAAPVRSRRDSSAPEARPARVGRSLCPLRGRCGGLNPRHLRRRDAGSSRAARGRCVPDQERLRTVGKDLHDDHGRLRREAPEQRGGRGWFRRSPHCVERRTISPQRVDRPMPLPVSKQSRLEQPIRKTASHQVLELCSHVSGPTIIHVGRHDCQDVHEATHPVQHVRNWMLGGSRSGGSSDRDDGDRGNCHQRHTARPHRSPGGLLMIRPTRTPVEVARTIPLSAPAARPRLRGASHANRQMRTVNRTAATVRARPTRSRAPAALTSGSCQRRDPLSRNRSSAAQALLRPTVVGVRGCRDGQRGDGKGTSETGSAG